MIKLSFFADSMIAYLENPQNQLKNYYKQQKFNYLADYKIRRKY